MAQQLPTDFPIDPTTTSGTALADILNRMNDAVRSTNAGPAAPPSTSPGMQWVDTSVNPSVLRIRNAANTGWGTIHIAGDAGGTPFLLPNGAVAAPALAFASEPGLGWYRESASRIAVAAAGGKVSVLDGASAATTSFAVYPRAVGSSSIQLLSVPAGTASYATATLGVTDAAGPFLQAAFGGRAEPTFRYVASSHIFSPATPSNGATIVLNKGITGTGSNLFGQLLNLSRWGLLLGNGDAESGSNAGSNFQIIRYSDAGAAIDAPITIFRNSGQINLSGFVQASMSLRAIAGFSWDAGVATGLNSVNYQPGSTRAVSIFDMGSIGDQCRLAVFHTPAVSTLLQFIVGGNAPTQAFNMNNSGQGSSSGGWVPSSDRRVKERLEPIANAMAILRKWTGYTFDKLDMQYMDGTPMRRAGLIAQEVQADVPECVDEMMFMDETFQIKKLTLDPFGPLAVLVNAVKELDVRIAQLETTA